MSKERTGRSARSCTAGPQIVLDESVTDLKTNVGLTQADFPF